MENKDVRQTAAITRGPVFWSPVHFAWKQDKYKKKKRKNKNKTKTIYKFVTLTIVPLSENVLVPTRGLKKKKKCFMCVSLVEVAVDPACLGILSDCLTDNPSHSQCVWQEEVSVNSLCCSHKAYEGQSLLSCLSWEDVHLSFIRRLERCVCVCVSIHHWMKKVYKTGKFVFWEETSLCRLIHINELKRINVNRLKPFEETCVDLSFNLWIKDF